MLMSVMESAGADVLIFQHLEKVSKDSIRKGEGKMDKLSQKELDILQVALDQMDTTLKDEFNIPYQEWSSQCHQTVGILATCAYGDRFDQLVHIGEDKFEAIKPLLAEKLATDYISCLIYSEITGEDLASVSGSVRDQAMNHAHKLIAEIAEDESVTIEDFNFAQVFEEVPVDGGVLL